MPSNISIWAPFLFRIKCLWFILPFTFLLSCKDKTVIIPDSVITRDSMAQVLSDIQLVEAMRTNKELTDSISKDTIMKIYSILFNKHGISEEQFEQSLDFYKDHPTLLEEIFDKTINELSSRQAVLGSKNTARADSIRKVREKPKVVIPKKEITGGKNWLGK